MKQFFSYIKLGVFVLSGLLFLVILLYMIGKNRNMFGSHLTLKTMFTDADGLKPGNNVRYAGIEIGTVSSVWFLSDTIVEVVMTVKDDVGRIIHKNAMVSIGTDGLVGNKVVSITPGQGNAPLIENNDLLEAKRKPSMDAMLRTLAGTNDDVSAIAAELKTTVQRINGSQAFWQLLSDRSIPSNIRSSARNISDMTSKADSITMALELAVNDLKHGRGLLGTMLYDTAITSQLRQGLIQFQQVGAQADSLVATLHLTVRNISSDILYGKGTLHDLLKDTSLAGKLSRSLDHIEKGADGFSKNMEALKHNFLFSGYFRKLEKQQAKENKTAGN